MRDFFTIVGEGVTVIGQGLRAIGAGVASMVDGSPQPERQEPSNDAGTHQYASARTTYMRTTGDKSVQDITINENGVRQHVRMEDGKVVASENVDDPEAFVKKYTDQANEAFATVDETFKDMSANMDETFKDMDEQFKKMFGDMDGRFKKMFGDR
jgi:hypothetical protein